VDDIVAGLIKVAETSGIEGQTFNLGTGREIRIGDLAQEVITLIGKPVKIVVDPNRLRPEKSEVQRLLADITKAKKVIGWEPQVALTEGLGQTIEWINQNLHRYQIGTYEK
jgi:dTDP-glucose 4,6-dehydratase